MERIIKIVFGRPHLRARLITIYIQQIMTFFLLGGGLWISAQILEILLDADKGNFTDFAMHNLMFITWAVGIIITYSAVMLSFQNTRLRESIDLRYWLNSDRNRLIIFNNKDSKEALFGIYITDNKKELIHTLYESEHDPQIISDRDFLSIEILDTSLQLENIRVWTSTHIKRVECAKMKKPWSPRSFS